MSKINIESNSTNYLIGIGTVCSLMFISIGSLYVSYKYGTYSANSANLTNINKQKLTNIIEEKKAVRHGYLMGISEGYSSGFSAGYHIANKEKQTSNIERLNSNTDITESHPLLYYYNLLSLDDFKQRYDIMPNNSL